MLGGPGMPQADLDSELMMIGRVATGVQLDLGECWPKTQGHETAAKAGVTSSNVDTAIRSSKKPEDWLALWGSRPPNAGKRSGL
eukprot:1896741-Rhodomonas_salina.2